MQQGLGPGVNQITPPPASLRVDFVPSFVRQEDFQRLFLQLEGCTDARLVASESGREQVGFAEFSDKLSAAKARNLYQNYGGYGGRGFSITLLDGAGYSGGGGGGGGPPPLAARPNAGLPPLQLPLGQKRLREADEYQPEPVGAGYKQLRTDAGASYLPQRQQQFGAPAGGAYAPQQPAAVSGSYIPAGPPLQQQQQQPAAMPQAYVPAVQGPPPVQAPASALPQQGFAVQPAGGGGGYGLPVQQQQPAPLSQAYTPAPAVQQAPQQQQGYLPAPHQQQGYAPAPQQQQGYAPAPQQQQAYAPAAAPVGQAYAPPAQQGYGGPPPPLQQQPGGPYGGPPQAQAGGGPYGGPPPAAAALGGPGGPGPGAAAYPHDACPTLYCDGLPEDVTRRELAHIFRQYPGFAGLRLVIKDSKKHAGEKLVMVFAEFSSTFYATEAMAALQNYVFDVDDPDSQRLFFKYARPLERPQEYFRDRRGGGGGGSARGGGGGARGGGGGGDRRGGGGARGGPAASPRGQQR